MPTRIRTGVLPWGQYTDWPSLQRAGRRTDELGYDSLWTWDHLYPIQGDWRGPIFEGYLTLTGWAAVTSRVTLGLMVGANPFRNPALTAKMVTTLDHISGRRAVLRIGGTWVGRDEAEIERTVWLGLVVLRDSPGEARRAEEVIRAQHPGYDEAGRIGTPQQIAEWLVPYVELGFHHIFFDLPAPFDDETLERF